MKKSTQNKNIATLLLICTLSSLFFLLLHYHDNKYTASDTILQQNPVILDTNLLSKGKVAWLVNGWDFWANSLIDPEQVENYPSIPIYIGQYFSFSDFHKEGSPYGVGTYRLRLSGNGEDYSIYIPEGFCASAVYVNGELVGGAGSVKPYIPSVKDVIVPIKLSTETELVIQTANYNHYYSGLTYPPAIGTADGISKLIACRMLFYGFLCFSSLSIALFSVAVWFGKSKKHESRINLWFGLLALSFALHICYPFIRLFGVPIIQPLYALEDTTAMICIWCTIRIILSLTQLSGKPWVRILDCIAGGFTVLTGLMPLLILQILPNFAPVYGQLIFWYKLLSALMLVGLVLYGGKCNHTHTTWLLAGVGVYAISLISRMFYLGNFEPAYTGWQDEWGTYALVLCFALLMVRRSLILTHEHAYLTKHLQEEVTEKTSKLTALLQERRQLLAGFAHDLKAPMTSMTTFARLVEDGGIGLDDETRIYLGAIRRKTEEMRGQLNKMQEFAIEDAQPIQPQRLDLTAMVREFHATNLPDMEVAGVKFELEISKCKPIIILGDSSRLTRVLQNLVYNAVSFTPVDGKIVLSLQQDEEYSKAIIQVYDTGSGIAPEDMPHIFERFFSKRQDDDGAGLGLYICKSIVLEHGGTISASSKLGLGSVFTVGLPKLNDEG